MKKLLLGAGIVAAGIFLAPCEAGSQSYFSGPGSTPFSNYPLGRDSSDYSWAKGIKGYQSQPPEICIPDVKIPACQWTPGLPEVGKSLAKRPKSYASDPEFKRLGERLRELNRR